MSYDEKEGTNARHEKHTRGQAAMEYLIVMGFIIILLIPLITIYYEESNVLNDKARAAMILRAATQVAEAADTVYYLGAPSMRTITINLPDHVRSVNVQGQSLTFTVNTGSDAYEQPAWSAANLTGTFSTSTGVHVLVLTALENDYVNITEE